VRTFAKAHLDPRPATARWAASRHARRDARAGLPPLRERVRTAAGEVPSKAAIAVIAANEAVITRFGPPSPAVWDPDDFAWSADVEAAYPTIRAEVEALLAGPTEIPHIEDVTGGIPQGNIGPWRSFVLMHQGTWIDWNCERCPGTTEVVRTIPGLTMAGFSVLEPGTHITTHRGPNKGALRHQLGVIVPGAEGDCRIRVGDEMLHWREGESVMFDFTFPHEAWNDSDAIRVLLMLEVVTPLPWYLDRPNRLAQHAMSWFPTTRDMANRLRALEPALQR
jgi:beta-hydroxylase